jgi:predicted AAA+ superfamily ATPase
MIQRHFWLNLIRRAWKDHNLVWLTGVRRAGKTYLCKSLGDIEYLDCEDIDDLARLEHPKNFYKSIKKPIVVIDEVHKHSDPSQLLKIGADYFSDLKIIATGSSTLAATQKFKDSLTGRKTVIKLTNMISDDLEDFANTDLQHRIKHGGLPPMFLRKLLANNLYSEWIDSYWAKDIEELFRIDNKRSFIKFCELMMVHSGGIFEATTYTDGCQVTRPTIQKYLSILEETHLVSVIKPFHKQASGEIVASPKVYAFDTGFVCYFNRWNTIHDNDKGRLWEHIVLTELQAKLQNTGAMIYYWRTKHKKEVDFIVLKRGCDPIAIECKWKRDAFETHGLQAFRALYPEGKNLVVTTDTAGTIHKTLKGMDVSFVSLNDLNI